MREHRGPYYAHWLVTSRDELQRRLRKLEAEIMRLDKEEADGTVQEPGAVHIG
jgi:hypothetical protein